MALKGTEKQIEWATDLIGKMHTELDACRKIAPVEFHKIFDIIENNMENAYAGDVIDILSGINDNDQRYYIKLRTSIMVSGCATALQIKKELK